MGILDKVFKSQRDISKEEMVEVPWHSLEDTVQLNQLESESSERTVAIFKHSTRCGISRMVLKKFEREYEPSEGEGVKLYLLDLLSNRTISDAVAEKWQVQHESPQLILIRDGQVVHHTSHQSIEAASLKEFA